jgi:outer membrane protein TolC
MKMIWLFILPLWAFSQSYGLKGLVEHAQKTNPMIKASTLKSKAKSKEIEAAGSAFWPTLDIGASYTKVNPYTLVNPGEVSTGYATVSMELYDGGRKSALKRAKTFEYHASLFQQEAFSKSVSLKIIDHYYTVLKLQAMLVALNGQSKELKAQLDRIKKLNAAGLATREDIDKLEAVYENNLYTVENTKLLLETRFENLRLESGVEVKELQRNRIKEPKKIVFEPYEQSKILKANSNALNESARAVDAGYLPQIVVQDTYSKNRYDQIDSSSGFDTDALLLDHQNRVSVSVNMRLFDHGQMKQEREALQYQKMALEAEREYSLREQKMQFRLSQKNLKTIRLKLKSAGSELKAARSTYKAIVKKFENGLVDNIAYLDALNNQTLAKARYDETRYEYEIAKSIYYYYAGKDPKEFIQ